MPLSPEHLAYLDPAERIRSFDEMPGIIHDLGRAGIKVFMVQGVFDVVHAGHTGLVQAARRISPGRTILVAALENDAAVRANKGDTRPVNSLAERLAVMAEFRSVSLAFGFDDVPRYNYPEDYLDRWRALGPAAVVAASWDPHLELKQWQARETGTEIACVDYQHENSTTRMLQRLGYSG